MRKQLAKWALAAACFAVAPLASADFLINTTNGVANINNFAQGTGTVTRVAGTGPNLGKDLIIIRGFNNAANGTGTKLLGLAVQMDVSSPIQADNHFFFRITNLDADNTPDADVLETVGGTINYSDGTNSGTEDVSKVRVIPAFLANASSANVGTAIRPTGTGANAGQFTAQTFIPANPSSNPNVVGEDPDAGGNPNLVVSATATANPGLTYNNTNVKTFRVEGAYLGPLVAPVANNNGNGTSTGSGSVFAVALVPSSATVTVSAQLAGDVGSAQQLATFTIPTLIPEPGTFGMLGLGVVGFLSRRRARKA